MGTATPAPRIAPSLTSMAAATPRDMLGMIATASTATPAIAAPLTATILSSDRGVWDKLRKDYETKRALSDSLPMNAPGEDAAIDDWCLAADTLILTPAPDHATLSFKIRLMEERCDGFEADAGFINAIIGDVERLGNVARAQSQLEDR